MAEIIQTKREREKAMVSDMIALYCRKQHGIKNDLYAVHCYKADMREKVRVVMRFSGPRMIFHHPVAAVRHVLETKKEKRRLENCNET